MTLLVIVAAFAVASSLAFLVVYAAVVKSGNISQHEDCIGELPAVLFPVTNGEPADAELLTSS